ncbi:uncharacterized protein LOC131682604 isoform X2 [Topomyia yanbarensis]|uniref:uncharacterized protein LOC131682603 isoform X3 n=1 Tax=Topomyia yanbarensis TaxID=2498891 RepID=UPI00273B2021|nr:uncharacterized protein LOC131682603 isoform X3 [Topomyia yanbarensis]XP_058820201.1 uncharacterized protein LOC131682604 isoform X2 [Topomyia yanbarensis]
MESFWEKIEKLLLCSIPDHIKNALELSGFISPAIENLSDAQIDDIETDVRLLSETMNLPATHQHLEKYWGRYSSNQSKFRFMAGERALIKKIANCVQQKGWSHFGKQKHKRPTNVRRGCQKDAMAIITRIVDYYECRNDGSSEITQLCSKLESIDVSFEETEETLKAKVRCPVCRHLITCSADYKGTWTISNFTSHLRNMHKIIGLKTSNFQQDKTPQAKKPCTSEIEPFQHKLLDDVLFDGDEYGMETLEEFMDETTENATRQEIFERSDSAIFEKSVSSVDFNESDLQQEDLSNNAIVAKPLLSEDLNS